MTAEPIFYDGDLYAITEDSQVWMIANPMWMGADCPDDIDPDGAEVIIQPEFGWERVA